VSKRLPPAERLRVEIDGVFAGGEDLAGAIERVAQLGARLLLQAALEAEVAPFLSRDRYERAPACEDPRTGMRNGYCPTTVKTTAGPITLERPKRRGTTEQFASQLFGKGVTKTNALESLVIAGFVRGLSTRDVQATLTEALGKSAAVSKSTVSRICADITEQFDTWCRRRLDDVELDYLFLDGSHFKYHANAAVEPVLAAWGIDTDGKPVFIGLEAASSESGEAWEGFISGRTGWTWPASPAAGDFRRRPRPARRHRAHHARRAAPTLPNPPLAHPCEGAQKRPSRSQNGLLGDLRSARRRRARPGSGQAGPSTNRRVCHTLARLLPGGSALPAR